jgi:hypothetical protein
VVLAVDNKVGCRGVDGSGVDGCGVDGGRVDGVDGLGGRLLAVVVGAAEGASAHAGSAIRAPAVSTAAAADRSLARRVFILGY